NAQARTPPTKLAKHGLQAAALVIHERVGWIEIQCPPPGVLEQSFQDRKVEGQALSRRRWRGNDDVASRTYSLDRIHLVLVQPVDASPPERGTQLLRQPRTEHRK